MQGSGRMTWSVTTGTAEQHRLPRQRSGSSFRSPRGHPCELRASFGQWRRFRSIAGFRRRRTAPRARCEKPRQASARKGKVRNAHMTFAIGVAKAFCAAGVEGSATYDEAVCPGWVSRFVNRRAAFTVCRVCRSPAGASLCAALARTACDMGDDLSLESRPARDAGYAVSRSNDAGASLRCGAFGRSARCGARHPRISVKRGRDTRPRNVRGNDC